ncbi:helix-turn-helix domain-containing protein [Streptomyces uncialis]|uniref:helix-turn-helix domain-containing protein n=1 Tax=Streptomyces uncialis TaxID=1048205 RepID=UPI0038696B3B|nr:helix-turn-helix domain-containing protein [Streptomyces uncialis]
MQTRSTVPRRQLGRNLRRLREEAGLTVRAAAARLDRSEATMWRIETGRTPLRPIDVQAICTVYGAPESITQALVGLAQETKTPAWWQSYGDAVPAGFDVFAGLEQAASQIDMYESDLMPGLLQTAEYVRVISQAHYPGMPTAEIESRVRFRMERQALLARPVPPTLRVALSEAVVLRPVGGPHVMAAQLAHLVYIAALPTVTLRVVPLAAGVHPGMLTSAFVLMRFPPSPGGVADEPPTVYGDTFTGGWYLDKSTEVSRYERAFAGIWSVALDEDATLRVLADGARRYRES